jgi:hypothetical protein
VDCSAEKLFNNNNDDDDNNNNNNNNNNGHCTHTSESANVKVQ